MKIRDRIKKFVRVPADQLRPNPKNWRTHPETQQNALRGVLAEIGISAAVIARELEDGTFMLIDGHLRAETLGNQKVPVLVLDVNEDESDKLLATLDPLASMAGKDTELLASLLKTLNEKEDSLAGLVWPDYVIDPLLAADWTPPQVEDDPEDNSGPSEKAARPIMLTREQREIVDAAFKHCRAYHESDELTEGQCIELICQAYLDD